MYSVYRALVVEDDAVARDATVVALQDEGFDCNCASNGAEAMTALNRSTFDVLITDLRMPKRHGHSLAVEVIARGPDRPLVVVLTGVSEPRLLKDLVAHDVDDIAIKPVDLTLFAAKIRALCDRRRRRQQSVVEGSSSTTATKSNTTVAAHRIASVSQEEVESRLLQWSRIPKIVRAAVDAFKLGTQSELNSKQIVSVLQCEPELCASVVQLANCSFLNTTAQKISTLEEAVTAYGHAQVGELAMAMATLSTTTQAGIPFIPFQRFWKKGVAAGICLRLLLANLSCENSATGMFCAAALQQMGRMLLASAFPELFQQMLERCATECKSLSGLERSAFSKTPGEIASMVLTSWGIPDSVHRPLRHIGSPFRDLLSIGEPLRERVELIKTAEFLGNIAVSTFDTWDLIDIPPSQLITRLGIRSVDPIVQQCRDDLAQISVPGASMANDEGLESFPLPTSALPSLRYKRLQLDSLDFIRPVLEATGTAIVEITYEVPDEENIIVNAVGAAVHHVIRCLRKPRIHKPIIISDTISAGRLEDYGRIIALPCAWSLLGNLLSTGKSV